MSEGTDRPTPLDALEPLDAPGPAEPLERAAADRLIESVLDRWEGGASASDAQPAATPRARWPWAVLAAAVVIAAAAAAWIGTRRAAEPDPGPVIAPRPRLAPAPPPDAVSPLEADDAVEPGDVVEVAESPEAAEAPPRPAARARPRPAPSSTPDDLLRRANLHRREARWREAEATYARVIREHPGTMSAYVARAGAASVRLEHLGDAAGARRLYAEALRMRPGGPLDAEVRAGLARAAQRLADRPGEIEALRGLVSAHSSSLAATRARERLEELGAGP